MIEQSGLTAQAGREAAKYQRALRDLLLAQHDAGGIAPALAKTNACVLLAHPPKIDKPLLEKQEWERGCACGFRDWI